jgi:protein phosphatase
VSDTGDADRTRALHAPAASRGRVDVLLQVSAKSDRGLVRDNNEDSFVVADLSATGGKDGDSTAGVSRVGRKGVLLAVSDGMGGQEAGEIASRLAVENLHSVLTEEWGGRAERDAVPELRNDIKSAIEKANRAVLQHVEANPSLAGMGATLTVAVVFGPTLVVAHVGDSRCYLFRDGYLKVLTADQSLAEELVRRGVVERNSAAYMARKSVLTRVVGQSGPLVPDSETFDLARGDRVLLCSDGLYGPVDDDTIRDVLADADDPDGAVDSLISEAKRRGAPDNVTCIAAFVSGDGLPKPIELDRGGGTQSVAIDSDTVDAIADSAVGPAGARKGSTGEFGTKQTGEDDTFVGTLPAERAPRSSGGPTTPPTVPSPTPVPAAAADPTVSGVGLSLYADPTVSGVGLPPEAAPAVAAAPAAPAPAPDPKPAPAPARVDGSNLAAIAAIVALIAGAVALTFALKRP